MTHRADGVDTSPDRAAHPRLPAYRSRRVLRIGIAISAVLHLVGIALYPVLFEGLSPEGVSLPFFSSSREEQGIEVIRLVEIDEDEEELDRSDVRDELPDATVPLVPGGLGVPGLEEEIEVDLRAPFPTAAERLRPNLRDPRIWAPLSRLPAELTPADVAELLASGRLQDWYDSVRVAEEALRRLTDWTFTDESGKRWGVADGRVYLGDFSLPLPFEFGVTPGNREEVNQRLYEFEEITRQGRQMEVQDSWRARSEAIRARRDRERSGGDSIRGPGSD
jgi:hypothetical protein